MLLNSEQLDVLQEIINIGIGNASGPLSELTQSHVRLEVPNVLVVKAIELGSALGKLNDENASVVEMGFKGVSQGKGILAFPKNDALELVEVLAGEKLGTPDMDSLKVGILTEFGNIILGQFFSAIGNLTKAHFKLCIPSYGEGKIETLLLSESPNEESIIIVVTAQFEIRDLKVQGNIFVLLSVDSLKNLVEAISSY